MKNKFLILIVFVLLIALFDITVSAPAKKLTKVWEYGSSVKKAWFPQWEDEWGGMNYWCIAQGNECGEWNWKAVYHLPSPTNPTPPSTCNSAYGIYLVNEAASALNIILPTNLGTPLYTEEWIDL